MVNLDALAAQLTSNKIAFGTENPNNAQLAQELGRAIENVESSGMGPVGVVVLEATPERVGDLRDIAQDLQNTTQLATVVVRTPRSTAAVSDSLTRAQVERGQFALISQPDYPAGIEAFAAEAQAGPSAQCSWGLVCALAVALIALVAAGTWWSVRSIDRHVHV